jgi:hypothetical protein
MSELRRFSIDFELGSIKDSLTITEQSSGLTEISQDDGNSECRHELSIEKLGNLVEDLQLSPTDDPFTKLCQLARGGKSQEILNALHAGDYPVSYVWP